MPYALATVQAMSQPKCPSVDHLLARSDGGLARVRLPGGRIDADGLVALAEAADRWGNGVVEMTNRANLQIRGVRTDAAAGLADALLSAGLSFGVYGDRRRNVLMGPLCDLDPDAVDYGPLLDPLLRALSSEPRLDALSDKFGLALDGGGAWPLTARRAAVIAQPGPEPSTAVVTCAWSPPRVLEQADLAIELAAIAATSINHSYRSIVVAGKAAPVAGPIGCGANWVGAMPTLGRVDATTLVGLAELARRHCSGTLRLTAWRSVLFPRPSEPGPLIAGLHRLGLVVDPNDPAAAVIACAGIAACTSALADVMGDARRVIEARRERGAPVKSIHFSGCNKCCAQCTPASITLIASEPGRYDIYRSGRVVATGLSAPQTIEEASTL